jgi:two-component system sensor histidine kinase KdpD
VAIWLLFGTAMWVLDGSWNLGNLALLLVLASTLASFWLSTTLALGVSVVAVALFNWFFVPPRFTFHVQLDQDLLLLTTLLCTSALISWLTSRLRLRARLESEDAHHTRLLRHMAEGLQRAVSVEAQIAVAQEQLQKWIQRPVTLWLQHENVPDDPTLQSALRAALSETGAIGPGTGRFEDLGVWVVPLQAGVRRLGCVAIGLATAEDFPSDWPAPRLQAQIQLIGEEVDRMQSSMQARLAHEKLNSQQIRNTLLAAISHDYRTPLATITGAASSLLEVSDPAQTKNAAKTILQEAEHLNRMTSNTLQLAKLDNSSDAAHRTWESVEELMGVALASARRRHPGRVIEIRLASNMPLLWCDPVLLVQLLDNLTENALRYSPASKPIRLSATALPESEPTAIQIEVVDQGIGIDPQWRNKIFDHFLRIPQQDQGETECVIASRNGMGLGLALCRAVAVAHDAALWIEDGEDGGTRVCLSMPLPAQPPRPPMEACV